MDFETLIFLLIALFYFFSLLGKNKQKQKRGQAPPPVEERPRDAEVDDALREIREALGWPGPQSEPETQREEARTEPPLRRQDRVERERRDPSPRPVEPIPERARNNRRAEKPRAEARSRESTPSQFDRYTGPVDTARPRKKEVRMKLPPPESPSQAKRSAGHPLLKQLRSSKGARQAVVFAEVIGPARWKKGGRRPGRN